MKILVTGGAGYIGSHTIIEILQNSSWDIISIDNYINSSPKTFKRIEKITGKKIKNYNIDLCDLNKTRKIFTNNPDIAGVIHFAALKSVPESILFPELYTHNNISSLNNILKCVKEFHVKHFIFSSSCSVYGNVTKLPVDELTPIKKALSPYGFTKQKGEKIVERYSRILPESNFISLRYFNPIGAHISGLTGENPVKKYDTLINDIIKNARGLDDYFIIHGNNYKTRDGTCIRDYVHVSDIANAHLLSLKYLLKSKNKYNYEVFNLGTGEGISVMEAIAAFEKINRIKLKIKIGNRRKGDIAAIYSNPLKAKIHLGWRTKYSIEEMMATVWEWQKRLKSKINV